MNNKIVDMTLGFIMGASIAMLLTPYSGKTYRKKIKSKIDELTGKMVLEKIKLDTFKGM